MVKGRGDQYDWAAKSIPRLLQEREAPVEGFPPQEYLNLRSSNAVSLRYDSAVLACFLVNCRKSRRRPIGNRNRRGNRRIEKKDGRRVAEGYRERGREKEG